MSFASKPFTHQTLQPFNYIVNNPSWEIARRLPTSLPNNVELTVHPEAVPVEYHPTFELVPQLYAQDEYDLVLHIGVFDGREFFAIEQSSSKTADMDWGYQNSKDHANETFTVQEQNAAWADQPTRLEPDLDLHQIVDLWQEKTSDITLPPIDTGSSVQSASTARVPAKVALDNVFHPSVLSQMRAADQGDDVQWSDNVGTFLCAFIYYTGLVEAGKKGSRDLTFMHVPYLKTEEQISAGVDITIELLNSMVESWRLGQA